MACFYWIEQLMYALQHTWTDTSASTLFLAGCTSVLSAASTCTHAD